MTPELGETIHFDFIISSSTGAAADADGTPTAAVYEDANDTAILSPTVTKRTSLTGNYRVPVACTTANGFEAGKSYNVIGSATVGGIAAKAVIGTFQVRKNYQQIARAMFGVKKVHYVRPSGAGALDGTDPDNAFALVSDACAVATAGEMIFFDGTIAQGTTQVSVPAGVILRGASEATAIITNTSTVGSRTAVTAGDNARLENFTIEGQAGAAVFALLLGYSTADATTKNVRVRNVTVRSDATTGGTDCFYFNSTGSDLGEWFIEDCTAIAAFDCHTILGTNNSQRIHYNRCKFRAVGPDDVTSTFQGVRAITATRGETYLTDCEVYAESGGDDVECRGVHARTAASNTSKIYLARCAITTRTQAGFSGNNYDLSVDSGSTLVAVDCTYDKSKLDATGTLTRVNTELTQIKTDTITADSIAASAITSSELADDAITAAKIAASAIGSSELADGAITATKLASDCITAAKIATGAVDADALATDAVTEIASAVGTATTGTGANVVTITVNDGSSALQNAIVRMTEGANTFFGTTNASGVVTFSLDNATYTISITKTGYSFTPTTQVVSGTTSATKSMTAITISPAADPATTNAYLTTYNENGAIESGVILSFRLLTPPGTAGQAHPGDVFTATSSGTSSNNLTVTLLRSATYQAWRGASTAPKKKVQFTTTDTSTFQLPEILGYDN